MVGASVTVESEQTPATHEVESAGLEQECQPEGSFLGIGIFSPLIILRFQMLTSRLIIFWSVYFLFLFL